MEDNLYPNSGKPYVPFKKSDEVNKDRSDLLAQVPVIEQIIKHLESQILFYDTVSSIPPEIRDDTEKFLRQVVINDSMAQLLTAEKEWIEEKLTLI